MKKLFLVATLCVAGLLSANNKTMLVLKNDGNKPKEQKKEVEQKKQKDDVPRLKCIAVESSCGETGFACDEPNIDGEIAWEVIDDMRQMLEEAFC